MIIQTITNREIISNFQKKMTLYIYKINNKSKTMMIKINRYKDKINNTKIYEKLIDYYLINKINIKINLYDIVKV